MVKRLQQISATGGAFMCGRGPFVVKAAAELLLITFFVQYDCLRAPGPLPSPQVEVDQPHRCSDHNGHASSKAEHEANDGPRVELTLAAIALVVERVTVRAAFTSRVICNCKL